MKKKIIISIFVIVLVLVVYLVIKFSTSTKNLASVSSPDSSVGTEISDNTSVIIKDTNLEDDAKIDNEDITYMESIENLNLEDIVENKIFAIEAKKRNIELTEKQIQEIDSLTSSIIQEDNTDSKKEVVKSYYTDITLAYNLKEKILKEIGSYSLSIDDDELNKKMEEYKNIQNKSGNISQNEIASELRKSYSLVQEMQKLYLSKIKEKYKVEYFSE